MPYEVRWEQKPHIRFLKLSGIVSEADFVAAVDQILALEREVPGSGVHTLIDAEEIQQLPPLLVMGREIRRLMAEASNDSPSTIFGVCRMVRYMMEMLIKVTPMRVRAFDTRQEALDFIQGMLASEQQINRNPDDDAG
jgi:hypothetical protein